MWLTSNISMARVPIFLRFHIGSWIYVLWIATKSFSFSCCSMHITWIWCNPRWNSSRLIHTLCLLLWMFCIPGSSAILKWFGFQPVLGESVLSILSNMGCWEMPTTGNIKQLILQVAQYELGHKPLGALLSLRHGVPPEYHPFFSGLSVGDLHKLYQALNVTPGSVISMIKESNEMTSSL